MKKIPSKEEVEATLPKIGYKNIQLNEKDTSVFLKNEGMKIGFGAIGKGFAANKARDKMKSLGIKNGIVIAGGDLITWGKMENGKNWIIGIADPSNPNNALSWLEVSDMGVVTSGNYEKFFIIDSVRYTHIINPKTVYPVRGLKSVTIIAPDAEFCDALATGVFVLGQEVGLSLINQLKGVECVMINDKNEIVSSKGIKMNYYKNQQYNKHQVTIGSTKKQKL